MVVTDVDTNHLLRIQEIEERFHSNLLSVDEKDIDALCRQGTRFARSSKARSSGLCKSCFIRDIAVDLHRPIAWFPGAWVMRAPLRGRLRAPARPHPGPGA